MKTHTQTILFVLTAILLFASMIQQATGVFSFKELNGVTQEQSKPVLSFQNLRNETYQSEAEVYLKQHYGFREPLTRLYNQNLWTFFHYSKVVEDQRIVITNDNWIFEPPTIEEYYQSLAYNYAKDSMEMAETFEVEAKRLYQIQQILEPYGTRLFVALLPGKEQICEEHIPKNTRYLKEKKITAFEYYSKRLKANYYSDAVKELLDEQVYQNLRNSGVIDSITVGDTPDKPPGGAPAGAGGTAPDIRIEMVAESDYDFVVKAAKKFNFEFFSIGGNVVFRKAKLNTQSLGTIKPHVSIITYDIGYDITGVVGEVKVRTLDIGKGTKVEVKKKNAGKFSLGSKAKPLISSQSYVYIDSAIESQADAENRANYILEDMSYRLGSLRMTFKGIPEFVPGRFITLKNFGDGASNTFYITDVIHEYYGSGSYITTIEGKAATL